MHYLCYERVVLCYRSIYFALNLVTCQRLDVSGWSLDIGERIGVASVYKEGREGFHGEAGE